MNIEGFVCEFLKEISFFLGGLFDELLASNPNFVWEDKYSSYDPPNY